MNIKSKINKSISSFSEYLLYQKGLSQNTVDSYKSDLTKLSNYLQNQDLSKTNIDNFFIGYYNIEYAVNLFSWWVFLVYRSSLLKIKGCAKYYTWIYRRFY